MDFACDWVRLNYVNLENDRIKPVTIVIPKEIRLQQEGSLLGRKILDLIKITNLRRQLNAQANARSSADRNIDQRR